MAEVRLDLEGMTCASCAARIERKLNKLEGVDATVNFATEQAMVTYDPEVGVDALVAAVEAAGYGAHQPTNTHVHGYDEPARIMRRRLVVSTMLTVPTALLAMVPPFQFPNWA